MKLPYVYLKKKGLIISIVYLQMMKSKYSVLILMVVGIILISGCGQQQIQKEDSIVPISSSQKESISIKNFAFNPAIINIKIGTTVTWTNEDSVSHTVTSEENFDSGTLTSGETFVFTFNDKGTFDYICTIHPSMKGKIIVN